jgi:hypothetical protein
MILIVILILGDNVGLHRKIRRKIRTEGCPAMFTGDSTMLSYGSPIQPAGARVRHDAKSAISIA